MNDHHNFDPKKVKQYDKIFIKTDFIPGFIKYIDELPPFILITGVSDGSLLKDYANDILENDKILYWVGTNIPYFHKKIIKIPIGLWEKDRNSMNDGITSNHHILKNVINKKVDFFKKKINYV